MTDAQMNSEDPSARPAPEPEAGVLRYLAPEDLTFARHGAALRMTVAGEQSVLRVTVLRAFPLSDPDRYLSMRDGGGQEVGVLRDPAALPAEAQALLAEELERRYVIPVITRVLEARERFGIVDWRVQTDRGERAFTTRNLRDAQVSPAPGRFVISDVDGNRYDIPDLEALDATSRAFLGQHL